MNYTDPVLREIAAYSPLDVLLADIAVRIQLTPTDHRLAVGHYHAIHEWLERDDSPLSGLVESFYPQGGFSIGATTARHAEDADFDIDAMVQLSVPTDSDPDDVLSTLHTAIRGKPGTRYYDKTERKSRCVTVKYDGMHLDVTPAVILPSLEARSGVIFHSKKIATGFQKERLIANPWGFAEWFLKRTPPESAAHKAVAKPRLRCAAWRAAAAPIRCSRTLCRLEREQDVEPVRRASTPGHLLDRCAGCSRAQRKDLPGIQPGLRSLRRAHRSLAGRPGLAARLHRRTSCFRRRHSTASQRPEPGRNA